MGQSRTGGERWLFDANSVSARPASAIVRALVDVRASAFKPARNRTRAPITRYYGGEPAERAAWRPPLGLR